MKTKTTHTPGPWEQEIAAYRRFRAKGTNIVNQHGTVGKLVGFSTEDRRLIAASPDLLAAAKALETNAYEKTNATGGYTGHIVVRELEYKALLAAVAKAEGK